MSVRILFSYGHYFLLWTLLHVVRHVIVLSRCIENDTFGTHKHGVLFLGIALRGIYTVDFIFSYRHVNVRHVIVWGSLKKALARVSEVGKTYLAKT
jgi:hypothetical protein